MWLAEQRYRTLSAAIAPAITAESLKRVDKTLVEAYSRATAQGATPEDLKKFDQNLIDKTNEVLSKENGRRVRQWTLAILEAEQRGPDTTFSLVLAMLIGFVVGAMLVMTIIVLSGLHLR